MKQSLLLLNTVVLLVGITVGTVAQVQNTGVLSKDGKVFLHPGILHSQASLDHISRVAANKTMPEYGSYELLMNHPLASDQYKMNGPYAVISRDGAYAYTNGNWGPIVTKMYLSTAIFLDNKAMYAKAVDFFYHANDNGTIQNYISDTTGQIQESGRDQGHAQLGVGALATICEIAHNQGADLYGAFDNRLLKGFEYVAKYNLGNEVPFETWKDVTGKYSDWTVISEKGRGRFIPIYEMVYNHYVRRKGLTMPYTEQVVLKMRPEGYDRDQPAFGTLLFNN